MPHRRVVRASLRAAELRCLKAVVSSAFSVREVELCAASRSRARAAFARQVAMYLAHITFGMSLVDVGSSFGRDRSTARHACRLVEDRREDWALDYALDHLERAARLWAFSVAAGEEGIRHG